MRRLIRTRTTQVAAAALLLLALGTIAPPARAGSSTYLDPIHGFTIKLPDRDWSQTPTQPNERLEVAKFKDDRQSDFSTLSILRFAKEEEKVTTTPGGAEGDPEVPPIPEIQLPPGFRQPQSAKAWLERDLQWRHKQWGLEWEGLPEAKKVDFGKIEGDLYEIELENKQWGARAGILAGIVTNGSEEYLLVFMHPNKMKKVLRAWTRSLRSFRFPGDEFEAADPEEDLDDRDKTKRKDLDESELLDPEKREKIKQGLVGEWRFIDTPHYLVIYNCDDKLAQYIAKRVEYFREFAFQTVFPPVEPIEECMIVRVCKEMDEYYHYGAPRGSAGYWSSGDDELVFPDLSRSKKPDEATLGVMAHEAFHQYIHYALLEHAPPIWFNEGSAEYFFCVESTGEKLKFMKRHPMRYSTVKSALGAGQLVPLKDFIQMTQPQYYSRASLCYAQGWAFATWLKNVTKDERYQQIPEVLFREMQQGYHAQRQGGGPRFFRGEYDEVIKKAIEKAFEGIDLDEMDEAFRKDLKTRM